MGRGQCVYDWNSMGECAKADAKAHISLWSEGARTAFFVGFYEGDFVGVVLLKDGDCTELLTCISTAREVDLATVE